MPLPAVLSPRRLVLLGLLVAVAGCGKISFVGKRYDNFTAYYNTFYNAERSYREAVEALDRTTEPIDRQRYVSVFPTPGRAINDQKFQAAIDKSADVLRDHPDSKWVDDALLLIGKSYYYQQNFPGAEQKFREVIDRASALEDEARLWLARTLIASGSYDEARDHLLESLNRDDLADRWEPSLRLAMGELHVKRGSFPEAVTELEAGLENVRDNRLEARGWFLLGQVHETLGQHAEAVGAYERVTGAHPRYELAYAAQLSAVRVKGMHVDSESALREVRRMERDDKNYTNRFELAYVRGRIYQSEGYAGDALALYHDVLYEADGQIGDVRGRIHYALGELYRDMFRDYPMASAHFDTARSVLQSPTESRSGGPQIATIYAPEAITDAGDQADMFGSFATVRGQISEMDSLLHLSTLNEEEFAAKIFEIRTKMAEDLAEQERRAERMQAERGFQNAGATGAGANRERLASGQNDATGSSGFLFHKDPVRVQEGRMNFIARWGERPHAPNWRRIATIQNVAANADSAGELPQQRVRDLDPSVGENPLPPLDYSDVPRDSLSVAALRAKRAASRYELANVLFLSMNQPDSAAFWYRTVIEEDDEFPVAQRAFYALAEVHRSLGDSVAATRLYEEVLREYPESDFAGRVREQLGIREDVPSDTLAQAEEHYDRAFQRWRHGSYGIALNQMVEVAAAYPRLEVAPRALLAAGRIFLEWADRDTLDIYGPLPLSVSDSLLGRAGLLNVADELSNEAEPGTPVPSDDAQGASAPPKQGLATTVDDQAARDDSAATDTMVRKDATFGSLADEDDRIAPVPDTTGADDVNVQDDEQLAQSPDTIIDEIRSERDSTDVSDVDVVAIRENGVADTSVTNLMDGDSTATEPTWLASVEEDDVYLKTLYAGVKQNYPRTSYADLADRLLRALEERQQELLAAADSAAAAAAAQSADSALAASDVSSLDSSGVASALPEGSANEVGRPGEKALAGGPEPAEEIGDSASVARPVPDSARDETPSTTNPESAELGIPQGEESIRSDGGVRPELGGYTLILGTDTNEGAMRALAAKYAENGFRTDVITKESDGRTVYRAALGHFATPRDAGMMMQKFASQIEEGVQITRIGDAE